MKNPFKIVKYFLIYRKNILLNRVYLENKFGFNIDRVNRLWTVIDLTSIPKEVKEQLTDEALEVTEIKKYIQSVNDNLAKLNLDELVNMYDIKLIRKNMWGISFGFSMYNNVFIYLWFYGIITLLITLGLIILL
jgi:hypothetical protein